MPNTDEQLLQLFESALRPGYFVTYSASFEFVSGLEEVGKELAKLLDEGRAETAVRLYEIFIGACYEKAEEIDDSGGNFGDFVQELFVGWMRAGQAAEADPGETVETLLAWMEDDPYGFCHRLDRRAVEVLDSSYLDAIESAALMKLDGDDSDHEGRGLSDVERGMWNGLLKRVHAKRGDVDAYVETCQADGPTPGDCETVAGILRERGHSQQALNWVERGLELQSGDRRWASGGDHSLEEMRRELLVELGRGSEALDSAWEKYCEYPDRYTYESLMRYVPEAERQEWHERAMEASNRCSLRSVVELWLETDELERLKQRVRKATDEELESLSHYRTEPLAARLREVDLALAARVYRALAVRILKAGKSKYYHAALDHIEAARDCYLDAGLTDDWAALVQQVQQKHGRKYKFMRGFDGIAQGRSRPRPPSFMDRARKRWPRG